MFLESETLGQWLYQQHKGTKMYRDLPRFIPVEGTKYVRDTENGAILNTDINELNAYKIKKQIREKEMKEKEEMKKRIDGLESSIQDIKDILIEMSKKG